MKFRVSMLPEHGPYLLFCKITGQLKKHFSNYSKKLFLVHFLNVQCYLAHLFINRHRIIEVLALYCTVNHNFLVLSFETKSSVGKFFEALKTIFYMHLEKAFKTMKFRKFGSQKKGRG